MSLAFFLSGKYPFRDTRGRPPEKDPSTPREYFAFAPASSPVRALINTAIGLSAPADTDRPRSARHIVPELAVFARLRRHGLGPGEVLLKALKNSPLMRQDPAMAVAIHLKGQNSPARGCQSFTEGILTLWWRAQHSDAS